MTALAFGLPADEATRRPMPPAEPVETPSPGAAVQIGGVSKAFGDTTVLADIDLAVAPGEFLAIVGKSGSGKSTLLRLIAGLDRPSGGRIEIDGRKLQGRAAEARMMFQEARLLPWRRVGQNVLIGAPVGTPQAAAQAALSQVGLADRAASWPAPLSGGQRQRVALARALISRPRLLLLDEPLGALDALTRLDMQDLIQRVWRAQGFTAILVTHDVAEAVRLADRVVALDQGRVAETWRITAPRPRRRADGALAAIESDILAQLLGSDA
jgi:sulfonate transport system ATP-binding protein